MAEIIVSPDSDPNYPTPSDSGVDYNTTPNDTSYYKGWFNTTQQFNDPLLTGFAFIRWVKVPTWVAGKFGGFAHLTAKNLRAFDLPGDIELQTGTMQAGFSTEEFAYINGVTKAQGFTMTHKEFSGSPIRHAYTYWVTGIRDPKTGVATYPIQHAIEYCAANHTGELLYVVTKPDATREDGTNIEFAAYFTNVMPLKAPLAHFNFSAGTQDNPELQINFTGNMHIGESVMAFASSTMGATVTHDGTTTYEYENTVTFPNQG